MQLDILNYKKIKKKYLIFLKSQEVMSEPFRDKIGQLNKFITLDEERRVPILISKNFTWISFLYKILNNIQKPYFFIKKKY